MSERLTSPPNVAPAAKSKSKRKRLAEAILHDRAERAARKAARPSPVKPERAEIDTFDPFAVTRWRVTAPASGSPGYLVATPMHRAKDGWFIACQACQREFESKGWKYCPDCMALPPEERRDQPKRAGRPCEGLGCDQRLSIHARADARYCSPACRKAAERAKCDKTGSPLPDTAPPEMSQLEGSETRIKRAFVIGPNDWPINVVGGRKLPQEKSSPLGRVRVRPWL